MVERKASDILLDLERKLDQLLGFVKTIDLNQKIILNHINKQGLSVPPPSTMEENTSSKPNPMTFPQVQSKSKLALALEQADKEEEEENQLTVESNPQIPKRNARFNAEASAKKIPVQQRILYTDGTNVCLAQFRITDSGNNVVKEGRTNQAGKWLAALLPGEYTVNITKSSNSLKPKVELAYQVSISNSETSVELEPKKA